MHVDIEDIEFLRGLRSPYTQITGILGLSWATLKQKASIISQNTPILWDREIVEIHPNDEECLLIGHLASCGITVPRARVRSS